MKVVEISGLSNRGDGLGRDEEGVVAFLPFTAVGDRVEARILKKEKRFWHGEVQRYLQRSEKRIEPRCPLFEECGGCHWQHLELQEQWFWKRRFLRDALQRLAGIDEVPEIEFRSTSQAYGTRSRVRMKLSRRGQPSFHRAFSHDLIEVQHCPVLVTILDRAIGILSERLPRLDLPLSEIRLLSDGLEKVLMAFFLERQRFSSSLSIGKLLERWWKPLQEEFSFFRGLLLFDGRKEIFSTGISSLEMGEPAVRYRPEGFAQASFEKNAVLLDVVKETLQNVPISEGIEIYAGSGNLTFALAAMGWKLTALEGDRRVIDDGNEMAKHHGFHERVHFHFFRDEKDRLNHFWPKEKGALPFLLIDPPRRGLSRKLREQILALQPKKILYISCDPATLSRDLNPFVKSGYRLLSATAVDLMPQTPHLESVLLLER